jgi:hypothetical protein
MSRLLAAALIVLLGRTAWAQDATSEELVIVDLRPTEEKEGTGLAPLSGKCNDDVYRIADVASDPLKLDILKDELSSQLRMTEGRKTLTVLNWSIYYNKQVQKSGGGLSSVGIQGYAIPGKKKERRAGSKCPRAESAGGWYEGSEIHSVYFPLVSEFSGTFGGKPINVRVVYSPQVKVAGKFTGGADDTKVLLAVVNETIEGVASAIDR